MKFRSTEAWGETLRIALNALWLISRGSCLGVKKPKRPDPNPVALGGPVTWLLIPKTAPSLMVRSAKP